MELYLNSSTVLLLLNLRNNDDIDDELFFETLTCLALCKKAPDKLTSILNYKLLVEG